MWQLYRQGHSACKHKQRAAKSPKSSKEKEETWSYMCWDQLADDEVADSMERELWELAHRSTELPRLPWVQPLPKVIIISQMVWAMAICRPTWRAVMTPWKNNY
ncbi:hypothetical protein K439DRAFT_1631910 [Ramaria rubella]|nr:hypothetical protein K439DRAFT_1631910 [Ramaria rubella]